MNVLTFVSIMPFIMMFILAYIVVLWYWPIKIYSECSFWKPVLGAHIFLGCGIGFVLWLLWGSMYLVSG